IKRVDLFGNGAEADGFLGVAHNSRTITCIIVYYEEVCLKPVVEAQRAFLTSFPPLFATRG
ncbi:MAG: hypothetical protein WA180_08125, partial [Candidatus Sulfotelmatobacter sp.]